MFKLEMKKAFHSSSFKIVLIIAVVIAVICGLFAINVWINNEIYVQNAHDQAWMKGTDVSPEYASYTLYNQWIGMDITSYMSSLFFILLPIFATLSYGWSYQYELKSGYVKNLITRDNKTKYFLVKYFATFSVGFLVAAIPLIINIIVAGQVVPLIDPDPAYTQYNYIQAGQLGGVLFYEHPMIFMIGKVLLISIFSGLVATLSTALTFVFNNRFAVIFLPFLFIFAFNYFSEAIFSMFSNIEFSPLKYLHVTTASANAWVILAEYLVLFAAGFFTTVFVGKKRDVF